MRGTQGLLAGSGASVGSPEGRALGHLKVYSLVCPVGDAGSWLGPLGFHIRSSVLTHSVALGFLRVSVLEREGQVGAASVL